MKQQWKWWEGLGIDRNERRELESCATTSGT